MERYLILFNNGQLVQQRGLNMTYLQLHDLGITNVEELNFYLDNCTLSIDETQEKIARYQQELDELAAIYDELEAS